MVDVRHDPATRAEIRAFVRAHHPDVGGDPEVFATGLARLRAREESADPRFDAPIEVQVRPRGLFGLAHRVRSRLHRRRNPRVR